MSGLREDLRHAQRALRARPGASLLVVLTLAVGLSTNTVLFSVVNALVLKTPAPGATEVGRLVRVMSGTRNDPYGDTSFEDFQDLGAGNRTLTLAAEGFLPVSARADEFAERAWALVVSSNYFQVLGVSPAAGRLLQADDARRTDLVGVVSRRFWDVALGGGEFADRSVTINGRSVAIVGILPEKFKGPGGIYVPDVWLLLERAIDLGLPAARFGRADRWLRLTGRLQPDATVTQADAEIRAIAGRLALTYPETNRDRVATAVPLDRGYPGERDAIVMASTLALAATGLVLLIACFNVASLLLARAVDRHREMGIRASLGASRARLVRQLLVESLLLALLAGLAGLFLSIWSHDLLSTFRLPAPIPQDIDLSPDGRAIGFAALLTVAAGILPTLAPAWHVSRPDLVRALKGEPVPIGRRAPASRLRNAFVVLQIAGSTAFLALAALFVQSFVRTTLADPGFNTKTTALVHLEPQLHGYDEPRARVLFETVAAQVASLPGVRAAGLVDFPPFGVGYPRRARISTTSADCQASDCPVATEYRVTPGYLDALGVDILLGRDVSTADDGSVAIVDQTLAEQLWPDRSPVGESFFVPSERRAVQVVGVARRVRLRTLSGTTPPVFYRHVAAEDAAGGLWLVFDARGTPSAILPSVRNLVAAIDPNLPPTAVKTMEEHMALPLWMPRTAAAFFLLCAVVSALLAAVGLFGVTHYAVGQRVRELGVRLALGASRPQVLALVLGDGLRLALVGMPLGVTAALVLARLVSWALVGVSPADVVTYIGIAALQALIAVAAALLPAYRATRVDPMATLRAE